MQTQQLRFSRDARHVVLAAVQVSNDRSGSVRPLSVAYGINAATATTGTASLSALNPRPTNSIEAPAPVKDRTQNVNAGADYFGTTFFGTKWNTNVRYVGAFYDNNITAFTVENPEALPSSSVPTIWSCCASLASANEEPATLFAVEFSAARPSRYDSRGVSMDWKP